jgi:hypothetical protein
MFTEPLPINDTGMKAGTYEGSRAIMNIPSFIKIDSDIQKLKGETYR